MNMQMFKLFYGCLNFKVLIVNLSLANFGGNILVDELSSDSENFRIHENK